MVFFERLTEHERTGRAKRGCAGNYFKHKMKPPSILIGCECSGRVRDAFLASGFFAMSCDLLPTETPGPHHQGDIFDVLYEPWDLVILHPPCDYLTVSGNRWFSDTAKAAPGVLTGEARREARRESVEFVKKLWAAPCPRIAIENPIGRLSSIWQKPTQAIQPWQFWDGNQGAGEVKATCLWLKGLPPLVPTTPNETGRHPACWLESPGKNRKRNRSVTYPGIAAAMADQWGRVLTVNSNEKLKLEAA